MSESGDEMTRAKFYTLEGRYIAFEVEGHSGYAEAGADIVCAAISTACQMVVVGLSEGYRLPIKYASNEASLKCSIAGLGYFDIMKAQCLFKTLFWTLEDISKQYPDNLQIELKGFIKGGEANGN